MEKMQYGLCCLSHVPMRRTVSDASEMLTELLFGDLVTVVDSYRQWVKVENRMDGYEGWVDSKQLMPLSKEEFDEHAADTSRFFTSDFLCALECQQEGSLLRVGMGCRLPFYRPDSRTFRMGQRLFVCHGEVMRSPESFAMGMDAMMERAVTLLKTPYLWGGKTNFALDCSGLTQCLFRMYGVDLPRDASQQACVGDSVALIDEARKGDLLFFDDGEGRIIHVGIYMGSGRIIHASGCVRIDSVDHQGIFRAESGVYSHHLRLIKRLA